MTDCPHRQVSLDWSDPGARLVGEPPRVEAASGFCVTCGRQVWGTEARAPAELAGDAGPSPPVWKAQEVMANPLAPSDRTLYAPAGWVPPTRAPTPPPHVDDWSDAVDPAQEQPIHWNGEAWVEGRREHAPPRCTHDWLDWEEGVPCQRAATHSNPDGAAVCPAHRICGAQPLSGTIPLSERCHYALPDGRFCNGYRGHGGRHEAKVLDRVTDPPAGRD